MDFDLVDFLDNWLSRLLFHLKLTMPTFDVLLDRAARGHNRHATVGLVRFELGNGKFSFNHVDFRLNLLPMPGSLEQYCPVGKDHVLRLRSRFFSPCLLGKNPHREEQRQHHQQSTETQHC